MRSLAVVESTKSVVESTNLGSISYAEPASALSFARSSCFRRHFVEASQLPARLADPILLPPPPSTQSLGASDDRVVSCPADRLEQAWISAD